MGGVNFLLGSLSLAIARPAREKRERHNRNPATIRSAEGGNQQSAPIDKMLVTALASRS
jgi:hypothetical protein